MKHDGSSPARIVLFAAAVSLLPQLRPNVPAAEGEPRARVSLMTGFDVSTFQKGNVHAHTNRSDGDSRPEEVIAWYRSHGYQFLAVTDHNKRSRPAEYAWLQDEHFRLLPGEEISMTGDGRQVHVNALCTIHTIGGGAFDSPASALSWAVNEVVAQDGIALINHPNFDHALALEDLMAVHGAALLEIKSGHPYVFSEGTMDRPSHETLWDQSLERGAGYMGVAVDDVHHLLVSADPPAFPGRAWVQVFADTNDERAVCDALRQGRLYSSTGPEIARIRATARSYTIWPRGLAAVWFVGRGGEELGHVDGADDAHPAEYVVRDSDALVRARVVTAQGTAWTPAIRITSSEKGLPDSPGARGRTRPSASLPW
jgi:hypothetical protein